MIKTESVILEMELRIRHNQEECGGNVNELTDLPPTERTPGPVGGIAIRFWCDQCGACQVVALTIL